MGRGKKEKIKRKETIRPSRPDLLYFIFGFLLKKSTNFIRFGMCQCKVHDVTRPFSASDNADWYHVADAVWAAWCMVSPPIAASRWPWLASSCPQDPVKVRGPPRISNPLLLLQQHYHQSCFCSTDYTEITGSNSNYHRYHTHCRSERPLDGPRRHHDS